MVGIFLLNLKATTRPLRAADALAQYRLFDYDDMSDEPIFPAHVVNDRTLVTEARQASRFDYTKPERRRRRPLAVRRRRARRRRRLGALGPASTTARCPTSDEYFAKAALDVTPIDWLLARLTYRPSFRRIGDYNTRRPPRAHGGRGRRRRDVQGQSVLLRKFDEADRDRQRVDLLLQFTPVETLSITPTASYIFDDYLSKLPVDPSGSGRQEFLGVQQAVGWTAGMDMSWAQSERISFTAGTCTSRTTARWSRAAVP